MKMGTGAELEYFLDLLICKVRGWVVKGTRVKLDTELLKGLPFRNRKRKRRIQSYKFKVENNSVQSRKQQCSKRQG